MFFWGGWGLRHWRDVIAPHSLICKLNSEQMVEHHFSFCVIAD